MTVGFCYLVWSHIKKSAGSPQISRVSARPIATQRDAKTGLQSDILKEGSGPGAKDGDKLTVDYIAWLTTGEKVDSSHERGKTLSFKLGYGKVIDGWDKALKGAKQGEKRKITVPSELAYGSKGQNKVPPNATIIFEVEVLKIEVR